MYKFAIIPGNNSFCIKKGLLKRGNWEEVIYAFYFENIKKS